MAGPVHVGRGRQMRIALAELFPEIHNEAGHATGIADRTGGGAGVRPSRT